ncbi:indole-3-glycerol phosphate synthase TrpC [bacterium]|nr:indole-3-glycerol phosphate synthase TrpC [bacterium]
MGAKKEEIRRNKRDRPESDLLRELRDVPPTVPFAKALRLVEHVSVIAEIKRSSPSAGRIREDFDLTAIAETYEKEEANAVSVLTDEKFFEGRLDYLQEVRENVSLPLLQKDFIIEPYQVLEARLHGADCLLLIMAFLSDTHCQELSSTARDLNLDVLCEVHTAPELERALRLGFTLIGINNRDLATFEVDLSTSETLMASVPPGTTLISESGIKNRADVERLGQAGVDGILVGESLMSQRNIGRALRDITGVPKWSR